LDNTPPGWIAASGEAAKLKTGKEMDGRTGAFPLFEAIFAHFARAYP
jgi:hypothetical protein